MTVQHHHHPSLTQHRHVGPNHTMIICTGRRNLLKVRLRNMNGSGPVMPWIGRNGFTLGNHDVTVPHTFSGRGYKPHNAQPSAAVGCIATHGVLPSDNTCDLPVLSTDPIKAGLLTDRAPVRMCKIVEPSVVPLLLRMAVLLLWNTKLPSLYWRTDNVHGWNYGKRRLRSLMFQQGVVTAKTIIWLDTSHLACKYSSVQQYVLPLLVKFTEHDVSTNTVRWYSVSHSKPQVNVIQDHYFIWKS